MAPIKARIKYYSIIKYEHFQVTLALFTHTKFHDVARNYRNLIYKLNEINFLAVLIFVRAHEDIIQDPSPISVRSKCVMPSILSQSSLADRIWSNKVLA